MEDRREGGRLEERCSAELLGRRRRDGRGRGKVQCAGFSFSFWMEACGAGSKGGAA
jgi:hypothetical protein